MVLGVIYAAYIYDKNMVKRVSITTSEGIDGID
jgi:hypothetical protein